MEEGVVAWATQIQTAARDVAASVIAYVPQLAGALLLLLIGWLAARLTRVVLVRGAGALSAAVTRLTPRRMARRMAVSRQALDLFGNVGFWAVLLLFVAAAAEAAALPVLSSWLDQIVAFMPRALAAAAIILLGWVLSGIARDAVTAPLSAAGMSHAGFVGVTIQATVLTASIIVGTSQIGIDVTFLTIIAATALGSILISFAVAFALGARDLVANLIGIQQMRTRFLVGQTVRIGDCEGEIVEFTPNAVVIDTEDGTLHVPGQRFSTDDTLLRPPGMAHHDGGKGGAA